MLTESHHAKLLSIYPAIAHLPLSIAGLLRSEGQELKFSAGKILFDEGLPCLSYFMPISGSVRIVKANRGSRELVLYRVHPGEFCIQTVGCLWADSLYSVRGVVDSDLTCITVTKGIFHSMIAESPEFRGYIFRDFGKRLLHLTDLIEAVAFQTLDQRLAQLLFDNGGSTKLTHQKLASELGSVREVISRLLEALRIRGIVELDRGEIRVRDRTALERLAGFKKTPCPDQGDEIRSVSDLGYRHK